MTRPIRILGIDPGLRRTGWGMVEIAGNRLVLSRLRLGDDATIGIRWRRGFSPSMTG